MKHLGVVKPLMFENCIILSLSQDWLQIFEKIPMFEVSIDKENKLSIVSMEEIK